METGNRAPDQGITKKSGSWIKWLIPALFICLFIAGLMVSLVKRPAPGLRGLPEPGSAEAQPSEMAPDFTMRDLNGEEHKLSDFRGKAVLINFWSTTCPACLMEMKSLENLSQQLKGKPFALIAITNNDSDDIKQFLDATGLKIPVYFDSEDEAHSRYGVMYLPVSYVIAPDGRLVDEFAGAADWSDTQVITYFQKLIEMSRPASPTP